MGQIVLIEDDVACRQMVRRVLAQKGHTVQEAATAPEGIELARRELPDLILSDINLGEVDGYSVLSVVRSTPALANVPVILMTGGADATSMRRGMEGGADDFLLKPFTAASLIGAVEARLKKQESVRREAAETQARLLAMLEATPDLVATARADGRLVYVNRAGRRLLGLGEAELAQGLTLRDLVPATQRERFRNETLPTAASEGMWSGEGLLQLPGDQQMPVSLVVLAHRVADGALESFSTIMRDLSQQKQAQSALSELAGALMRSQDDERRRLGRELHDSTAQSLAALEIGLTRVRKQAAVLDEGAREQLNQCLQLAKQCSKEIRTVSYLLHPPLLDEMGLISAVRWYLDGFSQRSGIEVKLDVPEAPCRLSPEYELALFRVVQEALSNIHRYAGSKTAQVRLAVDAQRVQLEVADQGRGIPTDQLRRFQVQGVSTGVGLSGMRERVHLLQGELEVDSDSTGTRIRVSLPLASTSHEQGAHPHRR